MIRKLITLFYYFTLISSEIGLSFVRKSSIKNVNRENMQFVIYDVENICSPSVHVKAASK